MKNESSKKNGNKKFGTRIPVTYNLRHHYTSKSDPKCVGEHRSITKEPLITGESWLVEHNAFVAKLTSKYLGARQQAQRYFARKARLPDDTIPTVSGHNGEQYRLFVPVHTDRNGWATAHPCPKWPEKPRKAVVYVNTVAIATEPCETLEKALERIFS